MRRLFLPLAISALLYTSGAYSEEPTSPHIVLLPEDMQWKDSPTSLFPGARITPLGGDISGTGQYTLRVKFPKGYKLAPHTHFQAESLTVLSGELFLGFGKEFDPARGQLLTPGSFVFIPRNFIHYLEAREEVVFQLQGNAPLTISFIKR